MRAESTLFTIVYDVTVHAGKIRLRFRKMPFLCQAQDCGGVIVSAVQIVEK